MYHVIYDGNCNLCVNSVKLLEQLDQGQQFRYAPMQDQPTLAQFNISAQDCELGIILINAANHSQRWQGTAAIEEIGRILPNGQLFVDTYRALPGAKWIGDRIYEQIRDNRYTLFGKRDATYLSVYPVCGEEGCGEEGCGEEGREK